ncbi:MAG: sialidase family protein [Armatimonadota bacterium]
MKSGVIFPSENWHNHSSCIIELPNEDMLVCWYHGSGERTADDVIVEGARLVKGSDKWTPRFLMGDTLDYPDCNPCMFVDAKQRIWLIYVTILANEWHTALLKYRISSEYEGTSCPKWDWSEVLHVTPGDEFVADVNAADYSNLHVIDTPKMEEELRKCTARQLELASDKLFRRLGWMPRAHPVVISKNRIILPLYSDGFDFSLMLISDDNGETWHPSRPILSCGGVQPSVIERNDGLLVAYMRNNGPAPHKIMLTVSTDRGESWSMPEYTDLPNPGAGIEAIKLFSGRWLMIYNDTESGRHRLATIISDDEGKTWTHNKYLENDEDKDTRGGYSYPSVVQSSDGDIWITYSSHVPDVGNTISWVHIDEKWLIS